MNTLRFALESAKREAVKRMPKNARYAKVSAHLSAAMRTLDEIEKGDK
jgi:hypothetical protein